MKIKSVQLMQPVGMSQTFLANDFDIEVNSMGVYLTPKKSESFRFRKRLIPFGNIAAIEEFTVEEEKKMQDAHEARIQAEQADVQAMQPVPPSVPVQADPVPAPVGKTDVIKFERDKSGTIVESKFAKLKDAKAEVSPD